MANNLLIFLEHFNLHILIKREILKFYAVSIILSFLKRISAPIAKGTMPIN